MMRRKNQRIAFIAVGLVFLASAAALVLLALEDSVVFFHTPVEVAEKNIQVGTRFRLGGLVGQGSVKQTEQAGVRFDVTDAEKTITVIYKGILPDLFREGQGVVAEGKLNPSGMFEADSVLAKHDEKYMPKEVADSLKKRGIWNEGDKAK
jgi:cytochrome c-type biogenesis protein CcmE